MANPPKNEASLAKIDFDDENRPQSGVERTLRVE